MSEPQLIQPSPDQLEKSIKALDWRDLELWGIGATILLALAAGFVLLLAPHLIVKLSASAYSSSLPQYTWGLLTLLLLLNAQTLYQRLRLQRTRARLVRQLQIAEREAQVDSLTGLSNRRHMQAVLEKEILRAERYRTSLCLAIIDVDRFKDFNTQFGHLEGDRVLTVVAELLRKNFRAADSVVRYGGDEFIVVMPDTDVRHAMLGIERLHRFYLTNWNSARKTGEYCITVTCGVAEFRMGMTAANLIHEADRLMLGIKSQRMREAGRQHTTVVGTAL